MLQVSTSKDVDRHSLVHSRSVVHHKNIMTSKPETLVTMTERIDFHKNKKTDYSYDIHVMDKNSRAEKMK